MIEREKLHPFMCNNIVGTMPSGLQFVRPTHTNI